MTPPPIRLSATLTPTPPAANQAPSAGFLAQSGHGPGLGTVTNPGSFGVMPISISPSEATVITITTGLASRQPAGPAARRGVNTAASSEHFAASLRTERLSALGFIPTRPRAGRLAESVLDDWARDSVLARGQRTDGAISLPAFSSAWITDAQAGQVEGPLNVPGFGPVSTEALPGPTLPEQPAGLTARLAAILLAAGYWGYGARIASSRNRRAGRAV